MHAHTHAHTHTCTHTHTHTTCQLGAYPNTQLHIIRQLIAMYNYAVACVQQIKKNGLLACQIFHDTMCGCICQSTGKLLTQVLTICSHMTDSTVCLFHMYVQCVQKCRSTSCKFSDLPTCHTFSRVSP